MNSDVKLPTDRKFGFFFGTVSLLVSTFLLFSQRIILSSLFLLVAISFILVAMVRPNLLSALNRLWMALGVALGRVVNPLVMGLIFYLIFVPTGLFMKLVGRDELRIRGTNRRTYWRRVSVASPVDEEDKFKRQF